MFIEVPRGSRRKREWRPSSGPVGSGTLVTEYLSPFASPFNYGCVRGQLSGDGDPADAVVLGPRREAGTEALVRLRGVVNFMDAGLPDPKLICSGAPLSTEEKRDVERFFARYAWARRLLNRMQGKSGETGVQSVEWG